MLKVVPLMPDRQAAKEIEEILEYMAGYAQQKSDAETYLGTEEVSQAPEGASPEEIKEFGEQKAKTIERLKERIAFLSTEIQGLKEQQDALLPRLKVSIDEERIKAPLDTFVYDQSFLKSAESRNQVGSLVSAMIEQISEENE